MFSLTTESRLLSDVCREGWLVEMLGLKMREERAVAANGPAHTQA